MISQAHNEAKQVKRDPAKETWTATHKHAIAPKRPYLFEIRNFLSWQAGYITFKQALNV